MLLTPLTVGVLSVSGVLGASGLVTMAAGTSVPDWLQYIQSGGVIGMFIVLFYALLTRKLVMGWTYDAMVSERDYYRGIAYKTTDISDRQVKVAEEMVSRLDNLNMRTELLDAREADLRREASRRTQNER